MQYVFHGKPSTSVRSGQPVNVDALYPLDKMGQQLFYEKFADKLTTEINPAFVGGFQPRGTSVYPVSLFHIQHRQIYLFNHSKIHKDMRQFKALTAYITFVKGQAYRVTTAPIDLQRFSASEAPSIPANLDVEATLARQVMRAMRKPIVFGTEASGGLYVAVSQTETKDVVGVLKRKVIIPPSQPATLISEDKRKLIGGVWRVKGETMKIPQLGTVRAKFNEAVAFGLFGIGLTGYHAFSVSTDVPSHLSHVVTLQIQDGPNNYVTFQDGTYISLEEVPWELPNGTEFYSIPDFGASPLIYFLKTVEHDGQLYALIDGKYYAMKLPAGYATATIFEAPPKPAEKQKEKQQEPQKQAAPTAAVEKKEEKKPEPVVVPDSPVKPAAGAEKKKSTTYLERISTPEAQYAAAGVAIKEAQAVDKAASVAIGHRKLTPAELEDQEKLKKNVAKGEGKYAAKDTLLADIVNRVLNPNGWLNDTVLSAYAAMANLRRAAYPMVSENLICCDSYAAVPLRSADPQIEASLGPEARSEVSLPVDHWFVIEMHRKSVSIYDSLARELKPQHKSSVTLCAEYLKKFLEDIPDAHRRWDSVYGDPAIRLEVTPQQEDDSSCGVFACDTMDKLMNSKEPNTKQKDVPELRQYIAAQLLAGKLFDQPSEKVL